MPIHRNRQDVANYAQILHLRGWVANHDGNVSVRDAPGEFMCTPTAWSKRLVAPEDVLIVDLPGKVRAGRRKPFGEWHLHKAAYTARPDAMAVIHAHPPVACGFAVAGRPLGRPALAEMVVSLGDDIPLLPYAPPKDDLGDQALMEALQKHDAVVLGNHGVLTVGDDLEQAYLRMELVEHWASILFHATLLGGARPLPDGDVGRFMEARAKAGLGPAGRVKPVKG
jgi:L-fuculose-phosphate aldolase